MLIGLLVRRLRFPGGGGKVQWKAQTPARSRIHPDAAAVRVDDPPDRGQPQAEALDVSNLFSAIKDFKKMGQVFRGNARTLVLNGEPDGWNLHLDGEPHPAMGRAILDGIFQQVFQDSLQ